MSLNDRKQNSRHNSYFEAYPLMKLLPVALHWLKAKRSDGLAASLHALISVLIMGVLLFGGATARADTVTYIHSDLSGSPQAATDESGNLLWRESYYAYGQRTQWQAAADEQSQWFHGKEQDTDTGMQYFGARYYDPSIGRFLGIDPIDYQDGNLHSFNRYGYGNNNPGKYKDPDGRTPLLIIPLVWVGSGALLSGGTNAISQWLMRGEVQWTGVGGVIDAAGDGAILGPIFGAAGRISTNVPVAAKANVPIAESNNAQIANNMGILRDAAQGKGNFGLGTSTRAETQSLGEAWVGANYKTASDGRTLISQDGLRQFRPPSQKRSSFATTGVQANFESRSRPEGQWQNNGHLNVIP